MICHIDITRMGGARPGSWFYYWISYKNNGTSILSGTVEFEYDFQLSFDTSTVTPSTHSANRLTWNFSNLPAFSTNRSILIGFLVDTSAQSGDTLNAIARVNPITGDTLPSDNEVHPWSIVGNSYDPNLKALVPQRDLYEEEVKNEDFLYYTIHFQNTGTDSAINIRVRDDLDTTLNIESFEMVSSSHDYTYELRGRRIVWYFDDIRLPDSGQSYLLSQGFVKFRIKANTVLGVGDSIYNGVNIFFDFNQPVYTDILTHIIEETVDTSTGPDAIIEESAQGFSFEVYPNPAKDLFTIRIESDVKEKHRLSYVQYNW